MTAASGAFTITFDDASLSQIVFADARAICAEGRLSGFDAAT
jgi:hypothetical protein